MSTLFYLVGLPGSGKSTWAKSMECEETIWLSSDRLREELYNDINDMDHNVEIFEEMRRRTKKYLKNGLNVIYDATNITSRKRKDFLGQLSKDVTKVCVYFPTDIDICLGRNSKRERKVPNEVINKMYKSLQIPMMHEGWDFVRIERPISNNIQYLNLDFINSYNDYLNILRGNRHMKDNIELEQDNTYHTLTASKHMYKAYTILKERTDNEDVLIASLLHDVGKAYCKNFKPNSQYANFIGHENVSAQLVFNYLHDCAFKIERILYISTLIQLHMRLMDFKKCGNGKEKLIDQIGQDMYNKLEMMFNADIDAK